MPNGATFRKKRKFNNDEQNIQRSEITIHRAATFNGCLLMGMCFKEKENRHIEINYNRRYLKKKTPELLFSEEGIKHPRKRCIEPEPIF